MEELPACAQGEKRISVHIFRNTSRLKQMHGFRNCVGNGSRIAK